MTKDTIRKAQSYLTIGSIKLMDIEDLARRHSITKILTMLEAVLRDRKDSVKDLIALGITSDELDRTLIEWFRISIAINLLKEEVIYERSEVKQGAVKGSRCA